jgi:hypothetical protein
MGLFSSFRKSSTASPSAAGPYRDSSTNLIYNLLFCDNLNLYKANTKPPYSYPFSILFSETSSFADLQKIISDTTCDPRMRILAYNRQLDSGHRAKYKELLAVIVEVGLVNGPDVLASFYKGTARYINQKGNIVIWEAADEISGGLTAKLFLESRQIVDQIGPWDKPRRPCPSKGNTRITFLVSDGLYFGEAPTNVLFNDPLASPALKTATALLEYITNKKIEKSK